MSMSVAKKRPAAGDDGEKSYEHDYYGWLQQQVSLLRAGRLNDADVENIAEELSDLGRTQLWRLQSSLKILIMHMLKWDQQAEHRSSSWAGSIREHRRRILRILSKNPGLKPQRDEVLSDGYEDAIVWAAHETGLPEDEFPPICPYDWDDILHRPFQLDRR